MTFWWLSVVSLFLVDDPLVNTYEFTKEFDNQIIVAIMAQWL